MTIKALFPLGQDSISVAGLYQWDYGQVLEIESADMGSEIVELHFSCSNMKEAIVRPCTLTNGIGTVTIPDDCLEQASPITAWIYEIKGTQGKTRKVITLPVIARTRPNATRDIPQEIANRYTELITEVNEAVDHLENGTVVAAKATQAVNANHAASAGNASSANYAVSAGRATSADSAATAETATNLKQNWISLNAGYDVHVNNGFSLGDIEQLQTGGLYAFNLLETNTDECATVLLAHWGLNYSHSSKAIFRNMEGIRIEVYLQYDGVNLRIFVRDADNFGSVDDFDVVVRYQRIA